MVESRSMVRGESPGSGPGLPCPGQQLAAHAVELTDVAQRKLRRKVPRVDGALTAQPRTPPSHRHAAHRRRRCSRRQLARRRPASASCPPCWPALARRRGQGDGRRVPAGPGARRGGRKEQAGIGHQAVIVKGDADTVGIVCGSIYWVSFFPGGFLFQTIIPDSKEHPPAASRAVPKAVHRWIRAKERYVPESKGWPCGIR